MQGQQGASLQLTARLQNELATFQPTLAINNGDIAYARHAPSTAGPSKWCSCPATLGDCFRKEDVLADHAVGAFIQPLHLAEDGCSRVNALVQGLCHTVGCVLW